MLLGAVLLACIAAPAHSGRSGQHAHPHILEQVRGLCDTTSFSDSPFSVACDHDGKGAWDARKKKLSGLDDCVALCRRCFRCAYVSFSVENHDCSWYQTCDLTNLLKGLVGVPQDYVSVRVQNVSMIAERIWGREGTPAVPPPVKARGVTVFTVS